MDAIAAMLPTLMVVKLSEQLGTGPAEQLGTGPAEPFVVVSSIPSRSLLSFCRVVDFIAAVAL